MMWDTFYQEPDPSLWRGREDEKREDRWFGHIQFCDLRKKELPQNGIGFLGFASDEGVRRNQGRVGAKEGPKALKQAIARLPYHGSPAVFYDCGTIIGTENLEGSQKALSEAVLRMAKGGLFSFVLGGGHEIAWGHFLGLIHRFDPNDLLILNLDAHFDLRKQKKASSGTPFLQIAEWYKAHNATFDYRCMGIQRGSNTPTLFQTAKEWGVKYLEADSWMNHPQEAEKMIEQIFETNKKIYLTICLDLFSSAYAPGVSAPNAIGVTPREVILILKKLIDSQQVVAIDIAECAPSLDPSGQTVQLASQLVFEGLNIYIPCT